MTALTEDLRYGEDVDLVWRLGAAGWQVRYDPRVIVAHQEPGRSRGHCYAGSATAHRPRWPCAIRAASPTSVGRWPTLVLGLVALRRPAAAAAVAGYQTQLIADRLSALGLPRRWAPRWFGEATLHTVVAFARYGATFGLPALLAIACRSRRRSFVALLTLPALYDRRARRADIDPLRWIVLALTDDAFYGAGVLCGCARASTISPLIPTVR